MIQVRRIGHATFETPDLDKAVDYYAAVNGLTLIGRGDATAYLASGTGLLTIALQRANAARCAIPPDRAAGRSFRACERPTS